MEIIRSNTKINKNETIEELTANKTRHNLASNIAPYEERKRWIESALISIDKGVLIIEDFILQNA